MHKVISLNDFLDDTDLDCDADMLLPDVEEIVDDQDALIVLGDDAWIVLTSGLHHRRQIVRLKSVVLLARMFPDSRTLEKFREILLDRRERRDFRFHVARHMHDFDESAVLTLIDELKNSKGCNDRIVSAILMGLVRKSPLVFDLLQSLGDTNDCVAVASFLSLMKRNLPSLARPLLSFVARASQLQLKLLEKNLGYYERCLLHAEIQDAVYIAIDRLKRGDSVWYLPGYWERSYSQERLSKLDRPNVGANSIQEEDDLIFYEV